MESCCDIMDQLPSEAYKTLFGDKVNDFVQLRSLRSRVKAKIVKFDKMLQNETPSVPAVQPKPVPEYQPTATPVTNPSSFDNDDEEEICPDLMDFLALNEEERDSWGREDEFDCKLCLLNQVVSCLTQNFASIQHH